MATFFYSLIVLMTFGRPCNASPVCLAASLQPPLRTNTMIWPLREELLHAEENCYIIENHTFPPEPYLR